MSKLAQGRSGRFFQRGRAPKRALDCARSTILVITYLILAAFGSTVSANASGAYIITDSGSANNNISTNWVQVTTFTADAAVDVRGIIFQIFNLGGGSGNIEIRVQAGGVDVATGSVSRTGLTADTDITVDFVSGFTTVASTQYVVQFRAPNQSGQPVGVKFSIVARLLATFDELTLDLSAASLDLTVGTAATSVTATADGGDGSYSFSIDPALPAGLSIDPGTGEISGTPTAAQAATSHTVTVTDGQNETATASIQITVSEVPARDDALVRDLFEQVTGAFIARRMERILSHEPGSYRLDRRRQGGGRPDLALRATGSDVVLAFSGSHVGSSGWHVWAEGHYAFYRDSNGTLGTRDGEFGILHIGADWLLNERLAVGLMVQVDAASEVIEGFADVSGRGWMAGPYISAELAPDLFLTARAAWGRSANEATVDVLGDIFSGNFQTARALVRARLDGRLQWGAVTVVPSADVAWMRERQEDYTVSDGMVTIDVEGQTFEIGRLTLSAGFEWPVEIQGTPAIVFVTPRYDWNFHVSGSSAEAIETSHGGMELGLRTGNGAGWQGEVALRYDGLGNTGFDAMSVRAMIGMRF